ncbi:MAG: acyl-CoA thioesterase [Candidatus Latescibacteria bacterium]|nr:acyl-CoA thioesterase [Candidatus Latescibacterota bacterium]
MSFSAEFPVRFQDVDAGGVLFFGRIYDYCHQAYEEFWGSEGVDRAHFFAGADYLVPIAHSEADYRSPVRHGERIRVRLDVARVGKASFELRYRITGAGDALRAEARTVHAFVNRATMKPIPIPEPLRAILLRHLAREPAPHLAS